MLSSIRFRVLAALSFVVVTGAAQGQSGLDFNIGRVPWKVTVEHLNSSESDKSISLTTLELSKPILLGKLVEPHLRFGLLVAQGSRTDYPSTGASTSSNAVGVIAGVGLRTKLLSQGQFVFGLDGTLQFEWSPGSPIPVGGTAVNGFARGGFFLAHRLPGGDRLEMIWRPYAHLSNGGEGGTRNPGWNGRGLGVSYRRAF
ncbi:MAG TPA: hypothetical protein VK171_16495 [Fimbriimonas sp.]|nr:hypothetical protein [Fimbriimonas sp.]